MESRGDTGQWSRDQIWARVCDIVTCLSHDRGDTRTMLGLESGHMIQMRRPERKDNDVCFVRDELIMSCTDVFMSARIHNS